MLKKLPLPISGLILALAALGNLVQSYSENIRYIFGGISAILLIMLILKIITDINFFKEEMKKPIIASVMPTTSMAIMLLATYIKPFNPNFGNIVWYVGVVLHIIFIIYFTIKFVFKFNIKMVFPSWFITYVGIVVASVTSGAFNNQIGKYAFYFGLIAYIILLFVVIYRLKHFELKEPELPLLTILAAPGSLCVAGYMNTFENKNIYFAMALLILSQFIYFYVIAKVSDMLFSKKIGFYPSFSGFTFPLVISAMALKLTTGYLGKLGKNITLLKYLVIIETIIAVIIVLYVLYKYLLFLFATKKDA